MVGPDAMPSDAKIAIIPSDFSSLQGLLPIIIAEQRGANIDAFIPIEKCGERPESGYPVKFHRIANPQLKNCITG